MVRVRILISMFQVLTGVGATFNIPYPDSYDETIKWLATIELDFVSAMPLGCVIPITFHTRFLVRTLLPLSAILVLKGISTFGPEVSRRRNGRSTDREGRADVYAGIFDACEAVAFFIMFLVYPSCSQYVFAMWQCVPVDDGTWWLRRDLSIDCNSPEHQAMTLFAICMLVVYPIGIPGYFAYKLQWQYGAGLEELQRLEARASSHEKLRSTSTSKVKIEDRAVIQLQSRVRGALAKRRAASAQSSSPPPSPPSQVPASAGEDAPTLPDTAKASTTPTYSATRRPSVADVAVASGGKNLWQKRRLSMQAKHATIVKQRTQQLAATMMKGVLYADSVRDLARKGKMGVVLPGSVLKMTEGCKLPPVIAQVHRCL